MADMNDNVFEEGTEDMDGTAIFTLTDEEGNEQDFALLGSLEVEGTRYMALVPVDEEGNEESEEYVILKCEADENGEESLVTIEDDEEFERIADIFDDELFSDISYDD